MSIAAIAGSSRRRRAGFAAVVLAVIAVHGCVTRQVAGSMDDLQAEQAATKRIEVAYVRELAPSAPPPDAPAPAAAAPPPATGVAPIAEAASAPEVPKPKKPAARKKAAAPSSPAASAPEPASDPAALAAAASAAASEPDSPTPPPVQVAEAASTPASDAVVAADAAPEPIVASAASAAGPRDTFEWPGSTRISYLLSGNYRGEVQGDAQVEWVRAGSRYQVHMDLTVGPSFAPVISRRMTSDGELGPDGLAPRRYDQDTKVAFSSRKRVSMTFEPDAVVLANGERQPSERGMQDTASQFVQLSYLFTIKPELLRIGNAIEVPLALPRKVDRWTYDVLGEETLSTPFGPLPAFHLKPRRAQPRLNELSAEIWFAPQLRYLPVRIRVQQDEATFIDLMIARRPELAGP